MDPFAEKVFAVLFATLGPLKTIVAFEALSRGQSYPRQAALACVGICFAAAIVGFTAFVSLDKMHTLGVSADALTVAGGAILFVAGLRRLTDDLPDAPSSTLATPDPRAARPKLVTTALWPLAAPSIVTPAAVVAILVFLEGTLNDDDARQTVFMLIGLMLVMNLVGMLAAGVILRIIGAAPLRIVGWLFSVLQTGMGVELVIAALRRMHVLV